MRELSYQGSLESPALPPNPPRSSALSYQGSPNQCVQSLCVTNSSLQTLLFQDSFLLYPLLPHTMSCVHCFTLCSFCFHGPTQTCTNALVMHPQKASVLRTPETTPEPYIYTLNITKFYIQYITVWLNHVIYIYTNTHVLTPYM